MNYYNDWMVVKFLVNLTFVTGITKYLSRNPIGTKQPSLVVMEHLSSLLCPLGYPRPLVLSRGL